MHIVLTDIKGKEIKKRYNEGKLNELTKRIRRRKLLNVRQPHD